MAKSWYILHTYTGYESKIKRTLDALLAEKKLDSSIVTDVKVPEEEVVEIKDGKKRSRKNKFLPGYVMLEMDLPDLGWKDTCSQIRRIQGVTGFVGTNPSDRPRPISNEEAKNLLQRCGQIKGEKTVRMKMSYNVGDAVKVTEGPFATFDGKIEKIDAEKNKLTVVVQIFGRDTPVEVDVMQVEKVI